MINDEVKAIFAAAAEARKERWIKHRRIAFMADISQVKTFHFLWEGWIDRFGKEGAVDFLLSAMCDQQVRLQEWDDARKSKRRSADRSRAVRK